MNTNTMDEALFCLLNKKNLFKASLYVCVQNIITELLYSFLINGACRTAS